MLMKFFSFLVFLFSSLFLFAEEELDVRLRSKSELSPIYLGATKKTDSPYSEAYVKELDALLSFDCGQTGFSYVLMQDGVREAKLQETSAPFDPSFWTKESARFVVKPSLEPSTLILEILDTQKGTVKRFASPSLSGNISSDREKIHLMLSQIQKDLFGVEGIFHKKILFSLRTKHPSQQEEWISEIWTSDFDGKNARQLTHEKSYCVSPRFLAKEPGAFVYVSYKLGQSKIFHSSVQEKDQWISLRGNQALPTLSFEADKLAFICDAAGRPDLFVQSLNGRGEPSGKPKQIFSSPRATQASPTFHPNGTTLAFVSDKDGPPRIYTLDLSHARRSGSVQAELITKKNRQNTSPSWSPDGTKIAYSAKTDDVRQVWIYDCEKKEEWQLTFGKTNMENPFWAPDSLHLILNSEDENTSELYIANIHQGEPVKITEGPGQKRFPSWEY